MAPMTIISLLLLLALSLSTELPPPPPEDDVSPATSPTSSPPAHHLSLASSPAVFSSSTPRSLSASSAMGDDLLSTVGFDSTEVLVPMSPPVTALPRLLRPRSPSRLDAPQSSAVPGSMDDENLSFLRDFMSIIDRGQGDDRITDAYTAAKEAFCDWQIRDGRGYLEEVKRQRKNTCWAIVAAEVVAAAINIHYPEEEFVELSIQELIDGCLSMQKATGGCPKKEKAESSQLGMKTALTWIVKHGIRRRSEYPCGSNWRNIFREKTPEEAITAIKFIKPMKPDYRNEAAVMNCVKMQPTTAMITITEDFMNLNAESKIFDGSGKTIANPDDPKLKAKHALLVVGYGYDEGQDKIYWKVKNSWGKIYARIVRPSSMETAEKHILSHFFYPSFQPTTLDEPERTGTKVEASLGLFNEVAKYQYLLALLLNEKKELTSKYEKLMQSLDEAIEILRREQAANLSGMSEIERREELLTKALGVEKKIVINLQNPLPEMHSQPANLKLVADSKLDEANALVNSIKERSLELEVRLQVADAMIAEINRKTAEMESKPKEVEALESALQRDHIPFSTECEAHERTSSRQREWKLEEREESVADIRRMSNQREENTNQKDIVFKNEQEGLNDAQKKLVLVNSALRKNEEVNSRMAAKVKEADFLKTSLAENDKELSVLEEKLDAWDRIEPAEPSFDMSRSEGRGKDTAPMHQVEPEDRCPVRVFYHYHDERPLSNQREENTNQKDILFKNEQEGLNDAQKKLVLVNSALRKNEEVNSRMAAKVKEADFLKTSLAENDKELSVLEEKLDAWDRIEPAEPSFDMSRSEGRGKDTDPMHQVEPEDRCPIRVFYHYHDERSSSQHNNVTFSYEGFELGSSNDGSSGQGGIRLLRTGKHETQHICTQHNFYAAKDNKKS